MKLSFRLIAVAVLWFPVSALAWSAKEHIMLTRIAARELIGDPDTPVEMKEWLKPALKDVPDLQAEEHYFMTAKVGKEPQGYSGLLKFAFQPDIHQFNDPRSSKVAPFNVHERMLHFIDIELFLKGDAKRGYKDDLSSKPSADDIPRDMTDPRYQQAGMLPIRVEYCVGKLVDAIRAGRMSESSQKLEAEEDSATRWAGYLAHYAEDNTQPQHATIDYKSASYFKNSRKAPNVHNEIEFRMIDDETDDFPELRKAYWPMLVKALQTVKDPVASDDPFLSTLEVSLKSYDALPLIGAAAREALVASSDNQPDKVDTVKFFRHAGTWNGQTATVMEMKAHQQAWAVQRVKRLWLKAWRDAKTPISR